MEAIVRLLNECLEFVTATCNSVTVTYITQLHPRPLCVDRE